MNCPLIVVVSPPFLVSPFPGCSSSFKTFTHHFPLPRGRPPFWKLLSWFADLKMCNKFLLRDFSHTNKYIYAMRLGVLLGLKQICTLPAVSTTFSQLQGGYYWSQSKHKFYFFGVTISLLACWKAESFTWDFLLPFLQSWVRSINQYWEIVSASWWFAKMIQQIFSNSTFMKWSRLNVKCSLVHYSPEQRSSCRVRIDKLSLASRRKLFTNSSCNERSHRLIACFVSLLLLTNYVRPTLYAYFRVMMV